VVDMMASENAPPAITPNSWLCINPPHDPPRGAIRVESQTQQPMISIQRGENASTHGESRCIQSLGSGQNGLDVSGYDYLALRARFSIASHSLGVCGVQGSECPLMLQLQYIARDGEITSVQAEPRAPFDFGALIEPQAESPVRSWYHGFYVLGQGNYPLRCSSCSQEHSFINPNSWYLYDTGNLLTQIPEDQLPQFLLNVSFYASGHQYDVRLDEVSLFAGNASQLAG
jgi:hypothetical protein